MATITSAPAVADLPPPSHEQRRAPVVGDASVFLFSIDYEDVRGELVGGRSNADRLPITTARYLALLRAHDVTATFFVSGDVAQTHPGLIADIISAGHEIGCHGWRHVAMDRYQPAQFKDDIAKSLDALYKAGAKRVVGFRAPYLSFTRRCEWAYAILSDLKFIYSSSVLPGRNPLYGWPEFGDQMRIVDGVHELPVSVVSLSSISLPFASGACFRIIPWFVARALLRKWRSGRRPLVGYVHPQDIDDEQAKIPYADYGRVGNMVLRHNRRRTLERLGDIFDDGWRVMPYVDYVEQYLPRGDN